MDALGAAVGLFLLEILIGTLVRLWTCFAKSLKCLFFPINLVLDCSYLINLDVCLLLLVLQPLAVATLVSKLAFLEGSSLHVQVLLASVTVISISKSN